MRLIGVAMVRNEADMIEAFVRTNLVLLDALYVVVHRASDGTAEILRALYGEGLQIRLLEVAEEAFRQEHYTNLAARAALRDERADFVFPLDADELVRAPDRAALEAALAALPEATLGAMPWITYLPTGEDRASPHPLLRLERRIRMSPMEALRLDYAKVAVGRWFASAPQARIQEGGHAVFDGPRQVPAVACGGVTLAHFPVRSGEHLATKAVLGWLALLLRGREVEDSEVGAHWRTLFARLKASGEVTDADFRAFLAAYVPPESRANEPILDPLPHRVETMRYAHLQRPRSLLQALMERTETLARLAGAATRASYAGGGSAGSAAGGATDSNTSR